MKEYQLKIIIDSVPNDEYHAYNAISSSNCKDLLKSPWLYDANRNNPKVQTPAMALGSMIHHLILEPDTFDQNYLVAEIPKRNSKKGKEAYAALEAKANGRKLIDVNDFLQAQEMRHNLNNNSLVCSLLSHGKAEQATFWQDDITGVYCKAKADFLNLKQGLIIDLKTTSSLASEMCFKHTIQKYQYQLSAAFYQDGFKQATGKQFDFFIVAVETFAPFNYAVYRLGDDLLQQGRVLYNEALRIYKDAAQTGNFAVPYHQGQLIELAA